MSCIVHSQVYNVLSALYLLHLQLMLGHCRKPDKVCDLHQQSKFRVSITPTTVHRSLKICVEKKNVKKCHMLLQRLGQNAVVYFCF